MSDVDLRPKIACLCVTYCRPRRLAEAIACFERQDYPPSLRELVVLDDAGQYAPIEGPRWTITSTRRRFRTLGEKRNAAAALASPDVDVYAVWDDDDIYLPWHLSAVARALAEGPWTVPNVLFRHMYGKLDVHANECSSRYYHPSWAFTRELFCRAGGYPFAQKGEDVALGERFESCGERPADSSAGGRPSFTYRWFGEPDAWHLSAMEQDGYERLAELKPSARLSQIQPRLSCDWEARCLDLLRTDAERTMG